MKRTSFKIAVLSLACFILASTVASGSVFTWVKVGKWRAKAFDAGSYSETCGTSVGYYYLGRDGFSRSSLRCWGTIMGCEDWEDEAGDEHAVWLAGPPYGSSDEILNQWELEDADGLTLRTYFRYRPPVVIVDGTTVSDPFPKPGLYEVVDPDKVPGTADVMVESHIRNKMGVEIRQRLLAWSQTNHDDYVVYDWTFFNTGNMDRDADIEQEQTLKGFYIMRQLQYFPNDGTREWPTWSGMLTGDSVRIAYSYPESKEGGPPDRFGDPQPSGLLRGPVFAGDVVLHVDSTGGGHVDEWKQPQMHCIGGPDILMLKHESGMRSETDHAFNYEVMQTGYSGTGIAEDVTHYMQDDPIFAGKVIPGTFHEMPLDYMKFINSMDPDWAFWHLVNSYSCGPYDFAFGDSIRFVWAQVAGAISTEKSWEVGLAHKAGTADEKWPEALDWPLPQAHIDHPEIMGEGDNDQVKDAWVYTGRDSLFQNAYAAQWNFREGYEIPIPPPAPDIELTSMPDMIKIEWDGWQSEDVDDFAGYRVYRALGGVDSTFHMIFECGGGTANALTHSFPDVTAERGKAYYYFVAAFDDGSEHDGDVFDTQGNPLSPAGTSLESGRYLNMATQAAYSMRAAATTLENVVVVPNPFNITAEALQYPGEPDKIMFMELPPVCTIKIYSESGDLVKTIEHTNLAADEPWGFLAEEQSVTETGQVIVSGVYIAYIETPDGESTFVKFVVVR